MIPGFGNNTISSVKQAKKSKTGKAVHVFANQADLSRYQLLSGGKNTLNPGSVNVSQVSRQNMI